jgi:hypothetical protein
MRQLRRAEAEWRYRADTAWAFRLWAAYTRGPSARLRLREDYCGEDLCCYPHFVARDALADGLRALPPRASRELAALIAPYDAAFIDRTVPMGTSRAARAWWWDRFVP